MKLISTEYENRKILIILAFEINSRLMIPAIFRNDSDNFFCSWKLKLFFWGFSIVEQSWSDHTLFDY